MNDSRNVTINRLPSGVPKLDDILGGGWPEYSFNLIVGEPGSGTIDNSGISRARIATQATREVQTGHAREAHVGNDDVRLEATGALEAIFRGFRRHRLKPHRNQTDRIHGRGVFVIIDEQPYRGLARQTAIPGDHEQP